MSMHSYIQILQLGPVQDKTWEGRSYQIQEAECVLLSDAGEFESVGVLRLSEDFRKDPPAKGTYQATFALKAAPKDRRIGAVVTGLTPVNPASLSRAAGASASAAKG